MKIVLLAHNLSVGGGLTVGQRVTSILPRLLPECRFLTSCPPGADYTDAADLPNVEIVRPSGPGLPRRLLWERGVLRRSICSFKPDWVFALGNIAFSGWSGPQSVLLHDSHHVYPINTFGQVSHRYHFKKWILKQVFRRSLIHPEAVYTQTDTIRQRLHRQYHFPLEKIHLFPPAYMPRVNDQDSLPVPEAMADASGELKLLYVSAPWGHKNHRMLIKTFEQHLDRLEGVRCFITVDPAMNALGRTIVDQIKTKGLGKKITTLGHLSPAEVQAAYRGADALIFPSILEAAGFPLIEAMEHGLPVLASNLDFAHELCGEGAGFFDPYCSNSVADAIVRLRDDRDYRTALARHSAERFEGHVRTWEDVLEEVIQIEGLRG